MPAGILYGLTAADRDAVRARLGSAPTVGDIGYRPGRAPVPVLVGKAYEDIPVGESGPVVVWKSSRGIWAESTTPLIARDWAQTGAKSGDRLLIFHHGQSVDDTASATPYLFIQLTGGDLYACVLTADMVDPPHADAGTAAATATSLTTGAATGAIAVRDDQGLWTRAKTGAKGLAVKLAEKFYLVECQSLAGWVRFTLNADLDGGSAAATRTDFGGSQQDVQDPETTITVHDGAGLFNRAKAECKGLAFYDAVGDEYVVVECQTMAGWIDFTLTADMSLVGNQAGCTVDDFGGSQNDVFTPGVVGMVVHDVQNMFSRAMIGAKGRAEYDAIENRYNVVECQSKAGWVRFTLNADLDGGSAAATRADFGGSQQDVQDPGSTITVHDGAGSFKRAKASCTGLAMYDAVDDEYNVVECQTRAGWIRFELTEDMSSGSAACTVAEIDFGGSQNDAFDPGRTPTVYDADGNFPLALDGAVGQAVYDSIDDKYYIVSCDQQALRLQALVKEEGTPSGVATDDADFQVDTLVVASPKPFSQLPATYADSSSELTVLNRYEFKLDDNAEVDIYYTGGAWVCVQGTCPTP